MKTIVLGQTGLEVSKVGFGGIPIQRLTEAKAIRVLHRCLDLGVTFLDTANAYTTSEERIGKAIAGRRHRVIIATKTMAPDKATAQEHLELSLRRLNTDFIDLWQFHNIGDFEKYERVLGPDGAMEAAKEAVQSGKVKHIGITSHSMEVAQKAIRSGLFKTIQFPFNFITCEPAEELVPLAQQRGLGFIAMKPFGGGLLGPANLAIKYLLQFDSVVPDPGIETVEEIEEIAAIVDGPWALTEYEHHEIEQLRGELGTRFCRRCDYCQPCPEGVRISAVMHLRSHWKRLPPEAFVSGWVGKAAETGRNCTQCGECEDKCPYHLPIREMLAENLDFYDQIMEQARRTT